jgi:hypothetical protein
MGLRMRPHDSAEGWKVNDKRGSPAVAGRTAASTAAVAQAPRLGISTVPADRLQPERPNQFWALEFMFNTTADGKPFKVL